MRQRLEPYPVLNQIICFIYLISCLLATWAQGTIFLVSISEQIRNPDLSEPWRHHKPICFRGIAFYYPPFVGENIELCIPCLGFDGARRIIA